MDGIEHVGSWDPKYSRFALFAWSRVKESYQLCLAIDLIGSDPVNWK